MARPSTPVSKTPAKSPVSATDGVPKPRRYYAIAAMSAGSALVIIDGGVANVALPTIARSLDVAPSSVVSIVTIYQVTLVMLMLPFAGLGERIGLKRTYQWGQLIFTVATLLCFFAKSLPFLLVVRAAQAVGAACVLAVASALIRQIYPSDQLGRGLAINSVVVTSSAAAAPTIGGLILGIAPWPWVFAAAIPFALISLALGRAIPAPKPRAGQIRPRRRDPVRRDVRPRHRRRRKRGPRRQPGGVRRDRARRRTGRLPLRARRNRQDRPDPAGRSARAARAGAVGGGRVHGLHRLDDASDLDPVPPPRGRLHRGGDRRGDHAVAAHQHDRRAARGLPVGPHPRRAARRHRHDRSRSSRSP